MLESSAEQIWSVRAEAAQTLSDLAAARHVGLRAPDDPAESLSLTYQPADSQTLARVAPSRPRPRLDLRRPAPDDLLIDLDGRPAANFASRAQQRAAALSMRLAEADYLAAQSADSPILLLDDVFSELDPARRERTAEAVAAVEQVILTTADPAVIPFQPTELAASYTIADAELRLDRGS